VTANRLEIALEHRQGLFSGKILEWLQKRSASFISSMVIGNNIALVIYGIVIAQVIEPVLYQIYANQYFVFITDTFISTLIILVTAEYLPKSIFKNNANELLTFFAPLALVFYIILFAPTYLMISLARGFIWLFQKEKFVIATDHARFGRIDLDNYIKEITENNSQEDIEHEIQIFQNALDFSSAKYGNV
jgi:putative hemolysin